MRIFLLIAFLLLSLYAEENRTRMLQQWLKFGFTNGDIAYIVDYLHKLEAQNRLLAQRVDVLEKNLLAQNHMIKDLLLAQLKRARTSAATTKRSTIHSNRNPSAQTASLDATRPNKHDNHSQPIQTTTFHPTVFETIDQTNVYDRPTGHIVTTLPKGYRITAYTKAGDWIKVSGHFPHGRWKDAPPHWWIAQSALQKKVR